MSLFYNMFTITLMISAPIIIAALGGLFSERSGVVNIALVIFAGKSVGPKAAGEIYDTGKR